MSDNPDSEEAAKQPSQWYVYLMRCADNSLYTGVTTNPERRVREHNGKVKGKGAKYTKHRSPVEVIYTEKYPDRSSCSKREYQVKSMSRKDKVKMIYG